jgi:hypothetical protein
MKAVRTTFNQFHQRFTRAFFVQKIGAKTQSQKASGKKAAQRLLYEKGVGKTLMKLTPLVNFINVFSRTFFVRTLFWQLFLVTFWLCQKFRTKNACVKR